MNQDKGTVECFFAGKPEELQLFNAVRECVEPLGAVKIEATKTQVSFGTKRKFAWVWFPPMWAKDRPEKSIVLTFGVGHQIKHGRIVQSVEPYPGRWTHHVIIQNISDIDQDVCGWLTEAYQFAERRYGEKL